MDNLTHTLFAFTLARTPLGRAGRGTTVALVLASNAPDVDVVTTLGGTASYLRWHRGPTHGPLGILGLGVATALLVWLGQRVLGHDPDEPADAPLRMLVPIAIIGVLCHVLMDLPTSYGTRLLSPFDWRWFAVDWMPILDIYLLVLLIAGLGFGQLSDSARRRNAALALMLMGVNYGVRAASHHQALAAAPRLFGPALPSRCEPVSADPLIDRWPRAMASTPADPARRCLVQLAAMPSFFSPFDWRVIAQLSNAYEMHDVNVLDERLREPPGETGAMWRTTIRVPNAWTPAVWTAASTDVGRTFLGFSRLPAARVIDYPDGLATVRWSDLRFDPRPTSGPQRNDPNRNSVFSVVVRVASDGHIIEQRFGP